MFHLGWVSAGQLDSMGRFLQDVQDSLEDSPGCSFSVPLLLEERRERAEGLQVLDGRGHHDSGQPGGRRPGNGILGIAEK